MDFARKVFHMKTLLAAMVVAAMVLVPLGIMGTASAAGTSRNLTTVVIGPVPTDRFGGGNLVAVEAGDALFGVRYGSSAHANHILIFAEYKRFLVAGHINDAQRHHLSTPGIAVYTH